MLWVFSVNAPGLILCKIKCITINNAFPKTLDGFKWKPNKIWVAKGSEICNRSIKS